MPGILYVVATPIGNLEDVTLRALRILREVSLIAAEDTRRTSKLLQHYSIPTPTTSLHEHNEHQKAPRLIERLRAGDSVALVSDAGTPAISDPGAKLVKLAHDAGITVQPVPGPSAVTALISAAGLGGDGFTFVGFPPNRSSDRKKWLEGLAAHPYPLVMYETPHRITETLRDLAEGFGDREIAIGRELTKVHEFLAIRPISQWLDEPPPRMGEFVLIVEPRGVDTGTHDKAHDSSDLAREFWRITNAGDLPRREALRRTARHFGVSTRAVFDAVEKHDK